MLRFALRLAGLFLLAGGFVALIVDGTRSIADNIVVITALGDTGRALAPERMAALPAALTRIDPLLWDPVVVDLLRLPTWLVAAVLGMLVFALGRKPKPKIGMAPR